MKWLVTAVLCMLTTSVHAQGLNPGLITLPSVLVCGEYNPDNSQSFEDLYGELPFLRGQVEVPTPDPRLVYYGNIRFFMNPETTSWSLVVDIEEELTCVIASGTSSEPFYTGDNI